MCGQEFQEQYPKHYQPQAPGILHPLFRSLPWPKLLALRSSMRTPAAVFLYLPRQSQNTYHSNAPLLLRVRILLGSASLWFP